MVVTPLMWKSIDNSNIAFSYLWQRPFEWDIKARKFIVTPRNKLIPFFLVNFVLLPMNNIFCLIILGGHLFGVISPSFINLVITTIILALSFANVISHSTVLMHLVLSCIDHVVLDGRQLARGTVRSSELSRNLHGYVQIQVLLSQLPLAAFETIVASLMLLGLLVCVTFNYVTIKMRHIIPITFYVYFPSVSVLTPIVIRIMLPKTVAIFEGGRVIRDTVWTTLLGLSSEKKYFKRKMKGIGEIAFYASFFQYRLYRLQNSTKATFYAVIIDRTITALLSIDSS
ncbi:hypothetical protein Fcan01_24354 [Folsomia candida]|uniref:Uncharacterized protein n=1 Tax=Folsomia candida TaxID=158441 RepID=A0A226D842_FOLCA|nr:hypothetical protein Fcan01_24354 [Folsomia candida]